MADIVVPLTGRAYFDINNELASILCEVGICVYRRAYQAQEPITQLIPEGWSLIHGGKDGDRLFLRYSDGKGHVQLFDAPPKRRLVRKWVFNPGDAEGSYQMVPEGPEVPKDIADAFLAAGGGPSNPDAAQAAADRKQQERWLQEEAQKKADNLQSGIIHAGLARR